MPLEFISIVAVNRKESKAVATAASTGKKEPFSSQRKTKLQMSHLSDSKAVVENALRSLRIISQQPKN